MFMRIFFVNVQCLYVEKVLALTLMTGLKFLMGK